MKLKTLLPKSFLNVANWDCVFELEGEKSWNDKVGEYQFSAKWSITGKVLKADPQSDDKQTWKLWRGRVHANMDERGHASNALINHDYHMTYSGNEVEFWLIIDLASNTYRLGFRVLGKAEMWSRELCGPSSLHFGACTPEEKNEKSDYDANSYFKIFRADLANNPMQLPKELIIEREKAIYKHNEYAQIASPVPLTVSWQLKPSKKHTLQEVLKWLWARLRQNAESSMVKDMRARVQADFDSWNGELTFPITLAHFESFHEWYLLVRSGSAWDFKKDVLHLFGEWVVDPDFHKEYRYDLWANLHYGFVGRAAGFSEYVLLNAAGVAQLMAKTSPGSPLAQALRVLKSGDFLAALDDPDDQAAVKLGASLWTGVGGPTIEQLEAAVRGFPLSSKSKRDEMS